MQIISEKDKCCGCTACKSICPKNAIDMIPDEEGFLYPFIDEKLCINCGLCKNVCPYSKKNFEYTLNLPLSYIGAVHKNEVIRSESTSGGFFSAIADYTVLKDGVIYGAEFDDNWNVRHGRAEKDYSSFRGSKYTQSDLGDTFKSVERDLKLGKYVLFTGTPCQIAGITSFFRNKKIDTTNILRCDIICHGTPSPNLWKDHITTLQSNGKKISEYYCRSKDKGWHAHTEKAVFTDGSVLCGTPLIQKQKELFYTNLGLRPSCYSCPFASEKRGSDLTFGDFWGVENSNTDKDDNRGCSIVLINTQKGKQVMDALENDIDTFLTNKEDCQQPNLVNPSTVDYKKRVSFWKDYRKYGYMYVVKKYTIYNNKYKKVLIDIIWVITHFRTYLGAKIKRESNSNE